MTNGVASHFLSLIRRHAWLMLLAMPVTAVADNWQLQVGAQTGDMARQALAFLPNEIWIHASDSIAWSFPANEVHTVTFLMPTQVRPNRLVGCPGGLAPDGRTSDFSIFDNSTCVNSGILTNQDGKTYTVMFPTPGNYKLVCLAHPNMTATVHVLQPAAALPHDQGFYDKEADRERAALLSDSMDGAHVHPGSNEIVAGVGHIIGNGGGTQTASVDRFREANKVIHVGDTVEWTTGEAVTNHTITFGPEPDPSHQIPPSANVQVDADGARHAYISSPADVVHSGFIAELSQDRTGLAQAPLGGSNAPTRFRVTFTAPGVYQYKCVLHDDLGMTGQVVVLP